MILDLLPQGIGIVPLKPPCLVFDLAAVLPGLASSPATQRAYYRWIDRYLCDVARATPARGEARVLRMGALRMDSDPEGGCQSTS